MKQMAVLAALACVSGLACATPLRPLEIPLVTRDPPTAPAKHYELPRYELTLRVSTVPAVRFRCSADLNGVTKTAEWDPQSNSGLLKAIYFPLTRDQRGALHSEMSGPPPELAVTCGSEVFHELAAGTATQQVIPYQYRLVPSAGKAAPPAEPKPPGAAEVPPAPWALPHELEYALTPLVSDGPSRVSLQVEYRLKVRSVQLSDILGHDVPIARTRSLDPLTPIVTDLAAVAANVAVDRAKAAGVRLLQRNLEHRLCNELTASNLRDFSIGLELRLPATNDPLFPRTCELVRTTTVDTLMAVPRMLARTLTADLAALLVRALENAPIPGDVRSVLAPTIQTAIAALIEGRAILTERDSQLLLLQAAQIGICNESSAEHPATDTCLVRTAVEAGLLLVAECIRDDQGCSADDLQGRLLESGAVEPNLKLALEKWRGLLPILARAVGVFQPPQGISPKATAKVALNTVLDILELLVAAESQQTYDKAQAEISNWGNQAVQQKLEEACTRKGGNADITLCNLAATDGHRTAADLNDTLKLRKESASAGIDIDFGIYLKLLRELVNAVTDDEPERAAQAVGAMLADVIAKELNNRCDDDGARCTARTPVTSDQIRRAFGFLNAILAYAATYKEHDDAGPNADIAKAQMEVRKKAMQDLIDSATDRRWRASEWVFSVGSAVGGSYAYYRDHDQHRWGPGLSLPTGIAAEWLPRRWFRGPLGLFGLHLQVTAFDLSQYVASPEGDSVKAEAGTAILPGIRAGLLLGDPDLCVLLGGGIGYAPRAHFSDQVAPGLLRAEVFAGVYVPFIDLN